MPVSAEYMIARGFDASVAHGTCMLHSEASVESLLRTMAKCIAAEQKSAQCFFGADWGMLTIEHYRTYAGVNCIQGSASLRQLGGKKALPMLAVLVKFNYIEVGEGGRYYPTRKGSDNYTANYVPAQA